MLLGKKFIPWDSIVAVQYKKASVLGGVGYFQLSLKGGDQRQKEACSKPQKMRTLQCGLIYTCREEKRGIC